MQTKAAIVTGLVALGLGQGTAAPPNDFGGMQRIERPPLMGVGTAVVDGTKTMQWERPPREGVGTVVDSPVFLEGFERPDPNDLLQQGKPVKWKFRVNAHVFGAGTIWECPGDRQPPNQQCSSARSPTEVNRCGDGGQQFWAYSFNNTAFSVPCGGPFPTVTLTYWRQDYAQLEQPQLYAAVIIDHPDGDCNHYSSTATLNPSYCPSPTPVPAPSPTPTPMPSATPTATPWPTPNCAPPTWACGCRDAGHGYIPQPVCCPDYTSVCSTCWEPTGGFQYCCCCIGNPVTWCLSASGITIPVYNFLTGEQKVFR